MILGSTGSIGRQAIDVIRANPDRFVVVGLTAGTDAEGLERQADSLGVDHTALGADGSVDLARDSDADVILNAIVGAAGLAATIAALETGARVALANKESLVAGGEACARAAAKGGGSIVPVDSEHAALAQCLEGRDPSQVSRLVLTASGGPFRQRSDLTGVTPDEALAHPTWSMGPKITIDCATLMNKGLEVIEAHHLFGYDYDHIGVLVHPQSVVHGLVELVDGTVVMQAATTDMRIPIQAALGGPERFDSRIPPIDLAAQGHLEFEEVDRTRFPSLDLAYRAGREGRTFPAVLNAANEEAVAAFLQRRAGFQDIPRVVEEVLSAHEGSEATEIGAVLEADRWAREAARTALADEATTVGGRR